MGEVEGTSFTIGGSDDAGNALNGSMNGHVRTQKESEFLGLKTCYTTEEQTAWLYLAGLSRTQKKSKEGWQFKGDIEKV